MARRTSMVAVSGLCEQGDVSQVAGGSMAHQINPSLLYAFERSLEIVGFSVYEQLGVSIINGQALNTMEFTFEPNPA